MKRNSCFDYGLNLLLDGSFELAEVLVEISLINDIERRLFRDTDSKHEEVSL
jgi:hypothetical protein